MNPQDSIETLAQRASQALILEASTAPKPGLVDRFDSGAHHDMDLNLFVNSLTDAFRAYLNAGLTHQGDSTDLQQMARQIGLRYEKKMFEATQGINTHKGAHFCFGFLMIALGYQMSQGLDSYTQADTPPLLKTVRQIANHLTAADFKNLSTKKNLSYGEHLYLKYGLKGVRHEVELGFPTVEAIALPCLRESRLRYDEERAIINCLLHVMETLDDTTVVNRCGMEGLAYLKTTARDFNHHKWIETDNYRNILSQMNRDFISRRLSPGGSADLLALTLFITDLEENNI